LELPSKRYLKVSPKRSPERISGQSSHQKEINPDEYLGVQVKAPIKNKVTWVGESRITRLWGTRTK